MPINGTLQLAGFVGATVAMMLSIIACFDSRWRTSDVSLRAIENQFTYSGLWKRCMELSTGHNDCDYFDHWFIGLPSLLLAGRIFTVFACVLFLCGRLIGTFGLQIINNNASTSSKAKMTVTAGMINTLAGLCVGIAVSWFAAEVTQQYHNPLASGVGIGAGTIGNQRIAAEYQSNATYILGRSLFFGWAAMLIGIASGILMICSSWGAMSDDDEDDGYDGRMDYGKQPVGYATGEPRGYV